MTMTTEDYDIILRTTKRVVGETTANSEVDPEDIAHDIVEYILRSGVQINNIANWCWPRARRRAIDAFRHVQVVTRTLAALHVHELFRRYTTQQSNPEEFVIACDNLREIARQLPHEAAQLIAADAHVGTRPHADIKRLSRVRTTTRKALSSGALRHVDVRPTPHFSLDVYY